MRHFLGFTLFEILLTLSLFGILAAIAYPVYHHATEETYHKMAKLELMHAATAMEAYYSEHHSFAEASLSALRLPNSIVNHHYELSIAAQSMDHFQLKASAVPPLQGSFSIDDGVTLR